jgi:hypothetical protein
LYSLNIKQEHYTSSFNIKTSTALCSSFPNINQRRLYPFSTNLQQQHGTPLTLIKELYISIP